MQLGENYVLNGNFEIVDSVKNMVGGTATVFQVIGDEAVRISTNVDQYGRFARSRNNGFQTCV